MPRCLLIRSVFLMNTATTDHPSSRLRVSDADRDRAIAELSEHYQAGRLTVDELEDRTGRALQARTAGELAELFTDLPGRPATMTSTVGVTGTTGVTAASPRPAWLPVVPIAIVAVIVLGGFLSGHPGLTVLIPVLVFLVIRRLTGGRVGVRPGTDRGGPTPPSSPRRS